MFHGSVWCEERIEDIEHVVMILCGFRPLGIHLLLIGSGLIEGATWRFSQADDPIVARIVWKAKAIVHHHWVEVNFQFVT
jgi:hypothetical protein